MCCFRENSIQNNRDKKKKIKMDYAIRADNLSKLYRLGVINRQTLVEEVRYAICKILRKDIQTEFGKIGHTAREKRFVEAQIAGEKNFWALRNASFEIKKGEVVGIIGKNGAGKSTLLKILSRITEPTEGQADLIGRVASLLEVGTGFHPELTGRENAYMNGTILGMKKREIDRKFDEIVAFSGLEKFIDTPVKRYSSGMYVRLAFAVAAHLEPEILLVDEVLAVGDIEFQRKCLGKMEDVSRSGRTILFVSHNMSAVNRLCERAILFDEGKIKKVGEVHEVTAAYQSVTGIQDGERIWDESAAPGSKEVRLLKASISGPEGVVRQAVPVNDDIEVKLIYRTLIPGVKFRCGASFRMEGTTAFATIEPTDVDHQNPGVYESTVQIPAHLLNEGEYTVSIWMFPSVGTKQIKYGYVKESDAIRFQVFDPLTGDSARGDYIKELPGLIRPRLEWKKSQLE